MWWGAGRKGQECPRGPVPVLTPTVCVQTPALLLSSCEMSGSLNFPVPLFPYLENGVSEDMGLPKD